MGNSLILASTQGTNFGLMVVLQQTAKTRVVGNR